MKTNIHPHKSRYFTLLLALILALAPAFSLSQTAQAEPIPCVVTSNADSGDGTLRAWLADTSCSTITFLDSYEIHLTSPLVIETGRTVTIDGAGRTVIITDDSYWRVFTIRTGTNATLQNLTITQSSTNFLWDDYSPMQAYYSLIKNLGNLTVTGTTLTGINATDRDAVGGGIYNEGMLTVRGSTFTNISAASGGAIYNDGYDDQTVTTTVENSTFSGNTSIQDAPGGLAYVYIGGGAIANFMGILTVTGSTFDANMALYAGGAISSIGPLTVTNSTFGNNSATTYGGAIFTYLGELTNNTFVGNSAANGAILFYNVGLSFTLHNNLMVKDSTGTNCSFQTGEGDLGAMTGSNNLADDGSCVTDSFTGVTTISTLSTQIGALGDYGGNTQTIPLLAGSAAIDAGDDSQCPATDQRGIARPQGSYCDIGAFEVETPSEYTISGSVYEDLNANGARDAGEMGVPATVILAISSDQVNFYPWHSTVAALDGSYEFTFPATQPEGFSFSVYVEQADGIKITQTPAPFAYPTGNLTGLDIGLHIVVLTPTPARFPDGVQGAAYSQTITVTGGDAPYTFTPATSWSVPAGLSAAFDSQAGTITLSGTPTEAGTFHTRVDIKDATGAFGQIREDFTIYPPMQFSPATLPNGSLGTAYNQTILLSGGIAPYTFVRYGGEQWLPTGLTLDTSNGNIVISGTPTEAGEVILDVYFKDQTGTEIEIQPIFWIKTDPSLTLTSSLNPSLQGQEVTLGLASTATVAVFPAPWGQVTFYADGTAIPTCEGLWMGSDPTTEEPAPNPITCTTSSLAVGSHTITASLTTVYGPYNNAVAALQGGQTVNTNVPQYISAGFGAPLDLGNVLNTAKAGQMIPLKWRLLDASGNPVLNLDPASVTLTVSTYACQTGVPTDAIETYAVGTTLLQNLGNGYYQLNWKTLSSYANSCRKLTLKIGDWSGDGFTALFQFKK